MKPNVTIILQNPIQFPVPLDFLKQIGYTYTFYSWNRATHRLRHSPLPDLILLYEEMLTSSLLTHCSILKSDPNIRSIPLMILTKFVNLEQQHQLFQLEIADYLSGPITESLLHSRMASVLYLHQKRQILKRKQQAFWESNHFLRLQLQTAMEIQQSLIPEYHTTLHGIQIQSRYLPASQISGDFYEVIHLNDHAVGIFIADVCGSGISAALLTSLLKLLFRSTAERHPRPDTLLQEMNQSIFDIFSGGSAAVYASAFFAYIDVWEKKITYCNAGHPLPILFDTSTKKCFQELYSSGTPLGLLRDANYTCSSTHYAKGNQLLFYTDGLSDTQYKQDTQHFLTLLKELLQHTNANKSQNTLIEQILQTFCQPNASAHYKKDDISFILCTL